MKKLFLISLLAVQAYAQCSSIQTGSSVFGPGGQGYVNWGGFIPGSQNPKAPSIHQQDITNAPVSANSAAWLATVASDSGGIMLANPITWSDNFGEGWLGQTFLYVHGDTARRVPIGLVDETSFGEGAGNGDPGTVPVPPEAVIANFMGPHARPHGIGIPSATVIPDGDKQLHVIDVDNCVEYDYYHCFYVAGTGLRCHEGGAYYMAAGDWQRPVGVPGTSNTSSVSGVPASFGRLGWDEYAAALKGTPIKHAINITALNTLWSAAFTGAAAMAQYENRSVPMVHNPARPPFGARLRMHPDVGGLDNMGLGATCAPLLDEAKHFGFVLVDGGPVPNVAVQENGDYWPEECVIPLAQVFTAANFDFVDQPQNNGVYCEYGATGCPDTLPTGSAPAVAGFTIGGSASATVPLGTARQVIPLRWSVSGITDIQGNAIPLRNISWGPGNHLGPGWINSARHGEGVNVTVCSAGCDFQSPGTYPIQLLVWNRFGATYKTINLIVTGS